MRELLPFLAGCVVGGAVTRLPMWARAVTLLLACLIAGALASAANGELASGYWAVFVSFDAILVWLGAAACTTTYWSWRRLRSDLPAARSPRV